MKSVIERVTNFANLYGAMQSCANGVRWKPSTIRFLQNGLENVETLRQELLTGEYRMGKQIRFQIREPKVREVTSLRFRDKVVQRSLIKNYLYHEITRHFIYDNVACQKGKGSKAAIKRLKVMMIKAYRLYANDYYIHYFDIRHFFNSTPHTVAKKAIRKRVGDPWVVSLVDMLIDSYPGGKGIGLGSDVAQFTELSVLDGMDHYIKEKLHEKFYLRYMDDFIIISGSKAHLRKDCEAIRKELGRRGLNLHETKSRIVPVRRGIKWQGHLFRQTATGKIIMTVDKQKIYHERRKLKRMVRLVKNGTIPKETADSSLRSWTAHAKPGNNHKVIQKMHKYYESLWRN